MNLGGLPNEEEDDEDECESSLLLRRIESGRGGRGYAFRGGQRFRLSSFARVCGQRGEDGDWGCAGFWRRVVRTEWPGELAVGEVGDKGVHSAEREVEDGV